MNFRSMVLVLIAVSAFRTVHGDQVAIYFSDGTSFEGEIVNATAKVVNWRMNSGGAVTSTPLAQIETVEFATTTEWDEAERELIQGNFQKAGQLFSAIANNRAGNYYPVPGNLASLALLKILECHRRLMNAQQVASIAGRIEPERKTLPPELRKFSARDAAWIAAGRNQWDQVVEISAESSDPELAYLRGVAHRTLGNFEAAFDGFTTAYALGFGSFPEIAKASLRGAAEMLVQMDDANRLPELQAQLKMYRELFGGGTLWQDAPDNFVQLADADLSTLELGLAGGQPQLSELPKGLPPQAERDWIHFLEANPSVFVTGLGAFPAKNEENPQAAPSRKGRDFYFSGDQFMHKYGISLRDNFIKLRAIYVPQRENCVLLNVGKVGPGFALYLKQGQAYFGWRNAGELIEIPLGPSPVNTQAEIILMVDPKGQIRGRITPQRYQVLGKISSHIGSKEKTLCAIAPQGKEETILEEDLERFRGYLRYLEVGVGKSGRDLNEKVAKQFGGKRVVAAPPPPPQDDQ